ncbi:MAG TPA: hypothetical protein VLI65_05820, partial [Pyrinomonadaceae bacterium]|nr:hypothetical protein [Pyrinomonadaceae bacterium]
MHRIRFTYLATLTLVAGLVFSTVPAGARTQPAGIDIAGMDKSVSPGDDFFRYANGGWFNATEIPADRTSFGAFDVIFDEVSKRTADIITAAGKSSKPEEKMVGDYYAAYLN